MNYIYIILISFSMMFASTSYSQNCCAKKKQECTKEAENKCMKKCIKPCDNKNASSCDMKCKKKCDKKCSKEQVKKCKTKSNCEKQCNSKSKTPVFNNLTDSLSYVLGSDIGRNLKKEYIEPNPEMVTYGIMSAITDSDTIFSEDLKNQIMKEFNNIHARKLEAISKQQLEENTKKGALFLEENKTKDSIVELPSGLQYKIVKVGEGTSPTINDTVMVHYRGSLIDGTVFDESISKNQPITFKVNQVIKGWQEGLTLIKPGGKAIFYIPSHLAYGDTKTGIIEAGSTLIFYVELLEVNPESYRNTSK